MSKFFQEFFECHSNLGFCQLFGFTIIYILLVIILELWESMWREKLLERLVSTIVDQLYASIRKCLKATRNQIQWLIVVYRVYKLKSINWRRSSGFIWSIQVGFSHYITVKPKCNVILADIQIKWKQISKVWVKKNAYQKWQYKIRQFNPLFIFQMILITEL